MVNEKLMKKKTIQTILDTIQAGINVVDTQGKIIYVNDAYCRMNNYTREEMLGKSLALILPEQDHREGLEHYKKIIRKKTDRQFTVESFNIRRDGSSFPVLISWNYLEENGELEGMVTVVQDISKLVKTEQSLKKSKQEVRQLKAKLEKREYLEYIMGDSSEIREVHKAVEKVARTDFSVVICGETGTGKEIIAEAIHNFSHREKKPFVSIDCGAIPETLIESELFGHTKGAFTGAVDTRNGAFQNANRGTIFLDEITNLSLDMQKKLLRVLQAKEVQKIGSTKKEHLNIRVISASNEDIVEMVKQGRFRRDLFYRLNEFIIYVPPLRERKGDIPLLTQRFLKEICAQLKCKRKSISKPAMRLMYDYEWSGNVRELKNALKRAIVISEAEIKPEHFDLISTVGKPVTYPIDRVELDISDYQELDLKGVVKEHSAKIEKEIIQKALHQFNGNKSKTARFLHIDYKTILQKIHNYGIV